MFKKPRDKIETNSCPDASEKSPDKCNSEIDAKSIEKLLDEHEAAARLNLKVATLRRWRWSGRGPPFIKLGGAVRYLPADVAAFIRHSRRNSTTQSGNGSDIGAP
jgi:predicted DNA-binding transcriptional regulator AlpA